MTDHALNAIRGIMLPSGEVLFSDTASDQCPWCELIDMQGCYMHLTCGQSAVAAQRAATVSSSRRRRAATDPSQMK